MIQSRLGQEIFQPRNLPDGLPGLMGFLGDRGRGLVPDLRRKRRAHRQALFNPRLAAFAIRRNAFHTASREILGHLGQELDGLQKIVRHHRQHHEQFKVACLPRHRNCDVVADDLRRRHHHRFGDDRIDFSGHDGRAGLGFRQYDLTQPAARARSHPSDVVGNF